jgi:hypothetical protein
MYIDKYQTNSNIHQRSTAQAQNNLPQAIKTTLPSSNEKTRHRQKQLA